MTRALQTTDTPALPTAANLAPTVTNQPLFASLLAGGLLADRVKARELTTTDLPALMSLSQELEQAQRPAPIKAIAAVVERVLAHYPRADLNDSAADGRLDDWYTDLEGLPFDILQAAARDYRHSEARFAPTPGQFLAIARRYYEPRMVAQRKAKMAIDLIGAER